MNNKTKLAFDLLEQEMEVLSNSENNRTKGGIDPVNGDVFVSANGQTLVWDPFLGDWYGGELNEVIVTKKSPPANSSSGYSDYWVWENHFTGSYGSFWLSSGGYVDGGGGGGGSTGGGDGGETYPVSDLYSASAFAGYTGLYVEKTASLFHYTAQEATELADIANALRATKIFVIAGKYIGVAGAVLTAMEGVQDANGFTWGDGAKVGIGIITTFTPYGWAYGVVDLATGVITGTTLTDALGNAIDGN